MDRFVNYESFGAKGDGRNDDLEAICRAHAYANENGMPVKAKAGACYHVGSRDLTAEIRTDTDWTGAEFIIDDTHPERYTQSIFCVTSDKQEYGLEIPPLSRGQKNLGVTLPARSLVIVKDESTRHFIRRGVNRNNGSPSTDCFVVEPDGTILNDVIWDFPACTATVYPINEKPLTVRGGTFHTIANPGAIDEKTGEYVSRYHYHARNLVIHRSNTVLVGFTSLVEGEGEIGAPYGGSVSINRCAYVEMRDCVLTGHKIYWTQGTGGRTPMGSYGLNMNSSAFVTLRGIRQTTDIMDRTRWGIMGTNFCKDLTLEDCVISRFDAHQGVTNCTIRRCRLGWQCLNAIGHGHFLIEDTEAFGNSLFNLRMDYGCFWDGDLVIRRCRWTPANADGSVIGAANDGMHNFGYPTMMPASVTIEGLVIDDAILPEGSRVPSILPVFDKTDGVEKPYPYQPTKTLAYSGVTTTSGRKPPLSYAPELYPDMKIVTR